MSEYINKRRFMVFAMTALMAAVVAQGAYLYRVHTQLNQMLARNGGQDTAWATLSNNALNTPSSGSARLVPAPQNNIGSSAWDSLFPSQSAASGWDPFAQMQQMHEQMSKLFGFAFQPFTAGPMVPLSSGQALSIPNAEVTQDAAHYIVRLPLNGFDPKQISVRLDNQRLTISGGSEKDSGKTTGHSWWSKKPVDTSQTRMQFEQSFELPGPVATGGMQTDVKDGNLIITLQKQTQ